MGAGDPPVHAGLQSKQYHLVAACLLTHACLELLLARPFLRVTELCVCNDCCGCTGFQQMGASNGTSGGSAISAAGWRFNICQDRGRCKVDPLDGISQWYRRMWQVGLHGVLDACVDLECVGRTVLQCAH
jgi:hypothetical protein